MLTVQFLLHRGKELASSPGSLCNVEKIGEPGDEASKELIDQAMQEQRKINTN